MQVVVQVGFCGGRHLAQKLSYVIQQPCLILIDGHCCGGVSGQHVDKAFCHTQLLYLLPDLGRDVKQGDACNTSDNSV
jgi:hypothetical protein